MIRAGEYREKITIQHKTVASQDAEGADVISWTSSTSGPYRAKVAFRQAYTGGEYYSLFQRFAEAECIWVIRWPGTTAAAAIKRESRLIWDSNQNREQDILFAEDLTGLKREFVIVCREMRT